MVTRDAARRARASLDSRFRRLEPAEVFASPHRGWIRAIRDALDMSADELGRRIGVSGPAVFSMERNERGGNIRISTLSRAADALECTLVYVFIPKHGLEETMKREARIVARAQLSRVAGTMALEDQSVRVDESLVETQASRLIEAGRVWAAPS